MPYACFVWPKTNADDSKSGAIFLFHFHKVVDFTEMTDKANEIDK